jgi:hypothetical protein
MSCEDVTLICPPALSSPVEDDVNPMSICFGSLAFAVASSPPAIAAELSGMAKKLSTLLKMLYPCKPVSFPESESVAIDKEIIDSALEFKANLLATAERSPRSVVDELSGDLEVIFPPRTRNVPLYMSTV